MYRVCKHMERAGIGAFSFQHVHMKQEKNSPPLIMSISRELPESFSKYKGWIATEKMEGIFARWEMGQMVTRGGVVLTPPERIIKHLKAKKYKNITLDGELWAGRGQFGIVAQGYMAPADSPLWNGIEYYPFDVPSMGDEPFEKRQQHPLIKTRDSQVILNTPEVLNGVLDGLRSVGGEGVVVHNPKGKYKPGSRSKEAFKVKTLYVETHSVQTIFSDDIDKFNRTRVLLTDGTFIRVPKGATKKLSSKSFITFEFNGFDGVRKIRPVFKKLR